MFFLIIIIIFIFAVSNREQKGVFNLLNHAFKMFVGIVYFFPYFSYKSDIV